MDTIAAFERYLAAQGMRMTAQRRLILAEFMREGGHVTAEELYRLVALRDPSVGQATVYRNIRLFLDAGVARAVEFGDGASHYEPSVGGEHHDHLICTACGTRVEVYDEAIEELQEQIAKRHGFRLTGHKLYLYGLCKACLSREKRGAPGP